MHIKTPDEIQKMRVAGHLAAQVLVMITPYVKAGITTQELNDICHDYITKDLEAIPAPLNYDGFPKSICTSPNYVVCHGIPGDKKLKDGDILNIDITVIKNGYHGDTSMMFFIGEPSIKAKRLVTIAQECLYLGIRMVKPGESFKRIGAAIQAHAEKSGCSIVREYCGHGIGSKFHEPDLQVVHYDHPKIPEMLIVPGMTFTIEPMVNAGRKEVKLLPDQWTVVTKDHSLSAQWEHTLLCTETGVEVLTLRPGEEI